MKFKNLFLVLFLTVTAVSCKDEGKNQENEATEVEVAANAFKVTLSFVAKKDDAFCLLYTEDGSVNFKDGVWKEVRGSEGEQTIEFPLPNDSFPTQLRLDLGKNGVQEEIVMKSIKFEYAGKTRELKGTEMAAFFRPDYSKCSFDAETGIIKAIEKDGKREVPSLYPHENVLAAELPKLAK